MKDWLVCLLGPLLGEVVKNMKDKRDGRLSAQQKVFVYSAVSRVACSLLYMASLVMQAGSVCSDAVFILQILILHKFAN